MRSGVVSWIERGLRFPFPSLSYAAIFRRRTESGRPAWSIRLRMATPTAASAFWPSKSRTRRQGPMILLYRPIAVSTRARCP